MKVYAGMETNALAVGGVRIGIREFTRRGSLTAGLSCSQIDDRVGAGAGSGAVYSSAEMGNYGAGIGSGYHMDGQFSHGVGSGWDVSGCGHSYDSRLCDCDLEHTGADGDGRGVGWGSGYDVWHRDLRYGNG